MHGNQQSAQGINPEMIQRASELREGETAEVKGVPESTQLAPDVPKSLQKKDAKKIEDTFRDVGAISVRPYLENGMENMGLENYGFVIFPGTAQEEQIAALERNGVVQYVTGLNEYAPEIINIDDEEQREAVIKNIRRIVVDLEKRLASNPIKDIEDEEFWNKVKLLNPSNSDFWSGISLRCTNEPIFLDPKKDPYDLIKLMAIEAGGFDLVAKSLEDARSRAVPPKFYLDKEIDTVSTRTEYKKLRNKASALLEEIASKDTRKLLYVTKVVDGYSAQYKYATPADVLYDRMDDHILGDGVEKNKQRAAKQFIAAANLDAETLKLKAIVRDCTFYNFIVPKPDGNLYHANTNRILGKNVSDVVEFLKNPANEDILKTVLNQVEEYWKQ